MNDEAKRADNLFDCIEEVGLTEEEVEESLRAAGFDPVKIGRSMVAAAAAALEQRVFRDAAAKALPGLDCRAALIPEILVALQAAGVDPTPLREEAHAAREHFLSAQERFLRK